MKLWKFKNIVLNPETITLARYMPVSAENAGPLLVIYTVGNIKPFEIVDEDAEHLYRILKGNSIDVETGGLESALLNT